MPLLTASDPLALALLVVVGAIASGINAVAGGGSLLSYPTIVGLGIPSNIANATNAVALWPGSLAGAFGFHNLLPKTAKYLKSLFLPTLVGSACGAQLFVMTSKQTFDLVVPFLILLAAVLLLLQPKVKAFVQRGDRVLHPAAGVIAQFLVSVYGGYFGAGMGIMMLAAFALYMEGTIHELNAVKSWLGLVINLVASILFVFKGLIHVPAAVALSVGSVIGGFYAAKLSQRIQQDKLRTAIAVYGIGMAAFYLWKTL
jgi:hypothetical protein